MIAGRYSSDPIQLDSETFASIDLEVLSQIAFVSESDLNLDLGLDVGTEAEASDSPESV